MYCFEITDTLFFSNFTRLALRYDEFSNVVQRITLRYDFCGRQSIPWTTVIREKLTVAELNQELPPVPYVTWSFITVFTKAHCLFLSWSGWIQFAHSRINIWDTSWFTCRSETGVRVLRVSATALTFRLMSASTAERRTDGRTDVSVVLGTVRCTCTDLPQASSCQRHLCEEVSGSVYTLQYKQTANLNVCLIQTARTKHVAHKWVMWG